MKNKRLGKGLEALIPQMSADEDQTRLDTLSEIEISKIHANPNQPRTEFDRQALDDLKQSIAENGVIQPITVRVVDDGFELIAGERRLRATTELGFRKIPAFVMEITSEDQMLELALIENIQREDLNPIEQAKAFQQLLKEYGLTQEQVSKKIGKDRATIANFVRLLKLPDIIQQSLRKNEISMGHARAIMGLSSRGDQMQVWRKTVKEGWSVRHVEKVIRDIASKPAKSKSTSSKKQSSQFVELEVELRDIYQTKVQVKSSGTGGRIELTYFSDDDLERLIELLQKARD